MHRSQVVMNLTTQGANRRNSRKIITEKCAKCREEKNENHDLPQEAGGIETKRHLILSYGQVTVGPRLPRFPFAQKFALNF